MDRCFEPADKPIYDLARRARKAAYSLARSPSAQRVRALYEAARSLRTNQSEILKANKQDITGLEASKAFLDRLTLTPERIESMAKGIENVADLPDPVGRLLEEWERPNGLKIRKISVPVGVIGMIYESRPNVGADAAAIGIKSGNALILRGGSESFETSRVILRVIHEGLKAASLPEDAVLMAPDSDRGHVADMLSASGLIDLIIPRGGRNLVERVQREARVPVLAHAEGLCHSYVHHKADPDMARKVLLNAKMRRPGICSATETLLIDQKIAPDLLPLLVADLSEKGCRFKADERARGFLPELPPASDEDFATEWLDAVLNIKVVNDMDEALAHIARFSSGHTEAIITADDKAARYFMDHTDSAVVMWNSSTQFCDGGEFGFGAEIGISTGRIHARGPVGPAQLETFRYEVVGSGQVRP